MSGSEYRNILSVIHRNILNVVHRNILSVVHRNILSVVHQLLMKLIATHTRPACLFVLPSTADGCELTY
jgi:hypothetical protein